MSTGTLPKQDTQPVKEKNEVLDIELIPHLTDTERDEVEHRVSISPAVVHESIRVEGERELNRSSFTLICSSLAAGLSMGFSLVARGLFHFYLPPAGWRPLVDSLGYSLGFLIVVLGRQQLFTENTLTVILPLLAHFSWHNILRVLRLWGIVLVGNLVGAFLFALLLTKTPLFPSSIQEVFTSLSQDALGGGFGQLFVKGIFAGWLIALMVWLLPAANTTRLHLIILITYIIGVGAFAHIIVDAVSTFYLVLLGKMDSLTALGATLFPILIGNIIGGVALVAVLNYGQVAGKTPRPGTRE